MISKRSRITLGFLLAAWVTAAQDCPRVAIGRPTQLVPLDNPSPGFMGHYVAVDDDTLVSGAYGDNTYGGSAYVFERDGSTHRQTAKLEASDTGRGNYYGLNVATSDGIVVIGGPFNPINGDESGSAYVYELDTVGIWRETRITPSDGRNFSYFGYAVSIDGDNLAIGARFARNELTYTPLAGAVYMYVRRRFGVWEMVEKIRGTRENTQFGDEVRIKRDVLLFGAPRDYGGRGSAQIYMYRDGRWQFRQEILHTPPPGVEIKLDDETARFETGDHFGEGVAISEDTRTIVIAGENCGSPRISDGGAAYVYVRFGESYRFIQHLFPTGWGAQRFGQRLAVHGGVILVGAWMNSERGAGSGAAYVYTRCDDGMWMYQEKLYLDGARAGDEFGKGVAINANYMVIGAPKRSTGGHDRQGLINVYPITHSDVPFVTPETRPETSEPEVTPGPTTTLLSYRRLPDPLAAGEDNVVQVVFDGGRANTRVFLRVFAAGRPDPLYSAMRYIADAGSGSRWFRVRIPATTSGSVMVNTVFREVLPSGRTLEYAVLRRRVRLIAA
mmetsp:Transcript_318/g.1047  ORF Transcript_318/g.1047 Transcript_318/m.1047 type:complete len:556 (-) Transcript_318:1571-3238(-)